MTSRRPHRLQRFVEILDQSFLGAFQDIAGQPLQERQILAVLLCDRALPGAEVRRERGDRILAAPPDEVIGELALLLRDHPVARQLFRIHDREIESGLHAMVEHHRVEHFAPRIGQAEGHVGDAQDGLAAGQSRLNRTDSLDRFDARPDIVAVAGNIGKTSASKMMSSGAMPYFSVSSLNERSAICILRWRLLAVTGNVTLEGTLQVVAGRVYFREAQDFSRH